jgi:hypothetical protein
VGEKAPYNRDKLAATLLCANAQLEHLSVVANAFLRVFVFGFLGHAEH